VAFAQDRVEAVKNALNSLTPPTSGNFGDMRIFFSQKDSIRAELDNSLKKLNELEEMLKLAHKRFKEANMEFEKANYLERIEIDNIILGKKKAEEKELDEIATMLYNNRIEER